MTLFTRAAEAMPSTPDFSQPWSHPAPFDAVASAAHEIAFDLVL